MTKQRVHVACCIVAISAALGGQPAFALTDQQVGAINSAVLDAVQDCTLDVKSVPEQIRLIAASNLPNPNEASNVASAIISAAQTVTTTPSCLFSVGEGLTRWALTFGKTNSTALTIATTIGQLGKIPVVNACVNVAGVDTELGLACDPPTSDVINGSQSREVPPFGNSSENPNQDNSSPN